MMFVRVKTKQRGGENALLNSETELSQGIQVRGEKGNNNFWYIIRENCV